MSLCDGRQSLSFGNDRQAMLDYQFFVRGKCRDANGTLCPTCCKKPVFVDVSPKVNPAWMECFIKAEQLLPDSFPGFEALRDFYLAAYGAKSAAYVDG